MSQRATRAQLDSGARGVAYRAWQLAGVASVLRRGAPTIGDPRDVVTIKNALVESALVNARSLAYFFTPSASPDLDISDFHPDWSDDVTGVAGEVLEPTSVHLSHVNKGARQGEGHPGEWPVLELAVVLVGGLARFVDALDEISDTYDRSWFDPSPTRTRQELLAVNPLAVPTAMSDNARVGALTLALQKYLEDN